LSATEHSATEPSVLLTGPTASGKGQVAFELARRLEADIVSVDSMKVYREMDVVTAKPSAERRRECAYHLIDIVDPDVSFIVADYRAAFDAIVDDCRRRGRPVVLCGGTSLYVKVLLEGLVEGPGADERVRERLTEEARRIGLDAMWERLRAVDPLAAERVCREDERRIVRFLEYYETAGRPISDAWRWSRRAAAGPEFRIFGLERDRAELYARIDRRVLRMVDDGLFDESNRLLDRTPPLGRSAAQCIGVKEIGAARESGESRDDTIARIQQNTRNFAKRQLTWFRKMEIEWLPVSSDFNAGEVADHLLERVRSGAREDAS